MRIFWRSLAVIAGLVLFLFIAVAIAVRTIDVNDFVGPIQTRVKDSTGRDLAIRSGIELKLSLEPKLVLNDVSLGNAPWGKEPQMLSAKRIEAQVALLPLLRRRFEVEQFHLVGPTIALETDPAGKGNWEFGSPPAATTSAVPAASGTARLDVFAIGDLAITNGVLTYRDGKSGKLTQVVIENLSVHARDAQSPLSAQFRGKVDDVSVALDGDFGPLETLLQRHWPYPVAMKGEINGQKASLVAKMRVADGGVGLEDIQLGMGSGKLTGQLTVMTGGPRPRLSFKFAAPTLSLTDLAVAGGAAAAAAKTADARTVKSRYVFKDEAIGVAALKAVDAEGELTIDKVVLSGGQHADRVHAQFSLQNGRLDAPMLTANIFGGTATAQLRMDTTRDSDAALTLRLDAKDMDLATVLAALGVARETQGGKTRVTLDVSAHGVSPRQWASSATGNATALVGQATFVHTKSDRTTPLAQLTSAINPFHEVDATTELQCAVIRMPLRNGVAQIDRSIAFETKKLAASASGTLDFRNETLELSIRPQVREGIPINVSQIAQLVRLRGPFTSPTVGIDAVASAATVARIGAAVSTGGWSLLGEALFSSATDNPAAPCQVALGGAAASRAATAKAEAPRKPGAPGLDEIGKALGRALGR